LTSVVFPDPDGPTNATVSPRSIAKDTSCSAGVLAVWCVKVTRSKDSVRSSPTSIGSAGLGSGGMDRIF
jgi:hypothetical protein